MQARPVVGRPVSDWAYTYARRVQQMFRLLDELRCGERAGEARPLHAHKLGWHDGAVFLGVVDRDGRDEGHAFGEQVRLLDGKFPFEAEVALLARLRVRRDERHEERAVVNLLANFCVPRVPATQFVFVEPHFESGTAQRLGDATRRRGVVTRVAEEDRLGRRVGHGRERHEGAGKISARHARRWRADLCGG